ncbi:MAG: hypothetical protein WAM05_09075 [Candidatus Binataceae bacterium]
MSYAPIGHHESFGDKEKAPDAFIGMLDGRIFGKVVVRVAA